VVNSRLRLRLWQGKTEQRHEVRAPHGAVLEVSVSVDFLATFQFLFVTLSHFLNELGGDERAWTANDWASDRV